MSSAENGRLVWISDEWIAEARDDWENGSGYPDLSVVIDARDAAPADPVEAAVDAYVDFDQRGSLEEQFTAVLAALGVPAPPQRPTPRDETPHG